MKVDRDSCVWTTEPFFSFIYVKYHLPTYNTIVLRAFFSFLSCVHIYFNKMYSRIFNALEEIKIPEGTKQL